VFNTLGSEQVAYYYLSFSIGTLILVIPTSFSTSIFVEGSHGIPLKELVKKSLSTTFLFLIPLIVIFLIFGDAILKLIGADYNEGFNLLIIMAISSIPFTIFQVFCSIKKVQNDINIIILFNLIISITILTLSYLFLDVFGITGVGYAWFIGYGIISLLIMVIINKKPILNKETYYKT
jgi:O-antigen/teichoic acid export membrane protein